MKLTNTQKEQKFIRSADPKELLAHIKTARFSFKSSEKELLKRENQDEIKLYLQKYGLSRSTWITVFRFNLLDVIRLLLPEIPNDRRILKDFLIHGDYQTITQYLMTSKDNLSDVFPEKELLESNNYGEIHAYMLTHRLTPFAQYWLIRRNIPLLTQTIINKGRLNQREKFAVMEYADWEETNLLIESEPDEKERQQLKEMQDIRFYSLQNLEDRLKACRLPKEVELFFFKVAHFSLVMSYVKHYEVENGSEVILSRATPSQALKYLSQSKLSKNGETFLLNRGSRHEIKAYIENHYFTEDNETRFIKRGKHNEIMLYLSKHSLCDTAQCELIYRRDAQEIEYYITHYPLTDSAETLLFEYASPETLRVWENSFLSLKPERYC